MSAPEEYEGEAAVYNALLIGAADMKPRTLLEFGSGGGNNASFMKHAYDEVVLVDLSPGMLDVSRRLNPDCQRLQGDMRTVRVGRQFDRRFEHSQIEPGSVDLSASYAPTT